ncbi:uncharacterized protein LOC119838266 [Zerene cesonia]|uniref:uncharacterized protein LOC119838266 n=1 Tax=Zerene cesonia TaxID=33412 RepID=UPI0018E520A4|nr:uncharacterized protein LOC119838266 [Zerene cesonia]
MQINKSEYCDQTMVLKVCDVVLVLCVIVSDVANVQARRVHKIFNNDVKHDIKVFKIPTSLHDGTIITLFGKIKFTETLQVDLKAKTMSENICSFIFSPKDGNVVAMSQTLILHNSSYNVSHITDLVTFSIRWIATSRTPSNSDIISILFESNDAGETFVEQCEFQSLSLIDEINVNGSAHIQRLSFDYKEQ